MDLCFQDGKGGGKAKFHLKSFQVSGLGYVDARCGSAPRIRLRACLWTQGHSLPYLSTYAKTLFAISTYLGASLGAPVLVYLPTQNGPDQ